MRAAQEWRTRRPRPSRQHRDSYVGLVENELVGYYTLAFGAMEHVEAPARIRKGLARHPIPLMVLARGAVANNWQATVSVSHSSRTRFSEPCRPQRSPGFAPSPCTPRTRRPGSLQAARQAYTGITIVGFDGDDYPVQWEGEEPYRKRCAPIVSARMVAGAANLAALLDAIWP
ncbi:MAG: hypothetical protein H0W08_21200 [Acidobacteria bacterium]|nr:hypothetical protein [Acidobacteriota bacterium]